jgi:hypothetical protein
VPPAAGRRVKVLTASLIALTSVLAAVGAWRASIASGAAGDADRKGFADNVAQTQQRAAIVARSDAILLDYVRMHAYRDRAAALRDQAASAADPSDAARLEAQAEADAKLADLIQTTVDRDALRPDGSLDLDRVFDVEFALASAQQDLDPAPDFAQSDRMRTKAERLVGLTALFIAAALFLTLAQVAGRTRRLYLSGGLTVLLGAVVLLAMVEVV